MLRSPRLPLRSLRLADDTPPVGLAAFVASGIARSDPIRTGIQGFKYDIRTAILPFLFIFNPHGDAGDASRRLAAVGLEIQLQDANVMIDYVAYDSPAYQQQLEYGWIISELRLATDRPSKYWVYIPVIGLLALVYVNQRRRLTLKRAPSIG